MTTAPPLQPDPADRGFRILAEMLLAAAAAKRAERPTLRVVEVAADVAIPSHE